jgi:predicted nucleic acid-binding protein
VIDLVFLDSEPLGLASKPNGRARADECRAWLGSLKAAGVWIVVPEIADYEVRRELIRSNATRGLDRLDSLYERYDLLLLDRESLLKAAELWALVRNAGMPTADPLALDGDAILAAQALTLVGPEDVAVVATGNVRHLARFPGVDARPWDVIDPPDGPR